MRFPWAGDVQSEGASSCVAKICYIFVEYSLCPWGFLKQAEELTELGASFRSWGRLKERKEARNGRKQGTPPLPVRLFFEKF